jgi:hypothetical protein
MKLELNRNESFIKLSLADDNSLNFNYGFDMDPIKEEDIDEAELSDEAQGKLMLMSLFAGLVTCGREYAEHVMEIGQAAIASGEFDVQSEKSAQLFDFMEELSEEDQKLMQATPKGEA